jgi:GNAT superfamily N-acetyltransferase
MADPFFESDYFEDPFAMGQGIGSTLVDPFARGGGFGPSAGIGSTLVDPFARGGGFGSNLVNPFSQMSITPYGGGLGGGNMMDLADRMITQMIMPLQNQLVESNQLQQQVLERNRRLSNALQEREQRQLRTGSPVAPWSTATNESDQTKKDPWTGETQFSHTTFERQAAKGDDGRLYEREEKLTTESDGSKRHTIRSTIDGSTKTSTWICLAGKDECDCPHMVTYSDKGRKDQL